MTLYGGRVRTLLSLGVAVAECASQGPDAAGAAQFAFNTLSRVSPVSHGVCNVVKRVVIIGTSVVFFGTKLTTQTKLGEAVLLFSIMGVHGAAHQACAAARDVCCAPVARTPCCGPRPHLQSWLCTEGVLCMAQALSLPSSAHTCTQRQPSAPSRSLPSS